VGADVVHPQEGFLFSFKSQGETVAKNIITLANTTMPRRPRTGTVLLTLTTSPERVEFCLLASSAEDSQAGCPRFLLATVNLGMICSISIYMVTSFLKNKKIGEE